MAEEGPFDGILGFSLGGALVSTLLISKFREHQEPLPFKCAFFLASRIPFDPAALQKDKARDLGPEEGELIPIPTAHIWGSKDELAKHTGPVLSELCNPHLKTEFIHQLGHEVPGARSPDAMKGMIRAIRRTIDQC